MSNWTAGDACDCQPMPINYWHTPGRGWEPASDISARGVAGAGALAEHDAARFIGSDADAWIIACPECHRIYAGVVS